LRKPGARRRRETGHRLRRMRVVAVNAGGRRF
jgi:hypothetical protein